MNKTLRQLFTAVIALFAILAMSSTIITAVAGSRLNADPRNTRALYHQIGAPRGAILASDGTVMAKSDRVNDAFEYQRSYSKGELYAPITGFFSITHPVDRGIEMSRNELLSGDADALFWQQFKSLMTGDENKGASIETSIDPKLQESTFSLLQGKDAAAVAIEPKTGRILAMASTPSYDPNTLAQHNTAASNKAYSDLTSVDNSPMINRTTSQYYPPGSTFKTVVAAAALESGKYQPDSSIPAGASYTLPGTATDLTNVEASANGSDGKISFEDAFAYSSNTAFAQLGVSLGDDAIAQQAKRFGFGESITVDGNDSTGSPMKAIASTFPTGIAADKLALASIGQGDVQETPLQNALIASAVANGGTLMRPTLVDRVRASDLSVVSQTQPAVMSQAFSHDTADKLNAMMQGVVTKENTNLEIDGIKVAAKTGTAQIGVANASIDGWVIGFAPADDPKIAVAVVVHNVDVLGSYAAGPIMKQMMQEVLQR